MPRDKQVSFPVMQRHLVLFDVGMILFCILCIIAAVIISKAFDWGVTTRP